MKNVIVKSRWMRLLGRSTCIKHILGKFGVKVSIGLKLQQIPMEGFYEYGVDDDDDHHHHHRLYSSGWALASA